MDDAWRPDTVWRHRVGQGPDDEADVQVFHEPDERYWIGVGLTRSRRYLVIEAGSMVLSSLVSLAATLTVTLLPRATVAVSLTATGATGAGCWTKFRTRS